MSHRLQVLIPESLDRAIAKAAQRRGSSKGEWVRNVLKQALQQAQTDEDPLQRLSILDAPTANIEQMLAEIDAGRR